MDITIDQYERLLRDYGTSKELAGKVNQIFTQGDSSLSDPEHEAVVAGFLQNSALDGLFEAIRPEALGTKVVPSDSRSTAIALLTKKGYEIVATDKDIAGETIDILARKPGTTEAVVVKCGPAIVRKLLGYMERPGTEMWLIDRKNRLFVFRRGSNWDSFLSFHKSRAGDAPAPAESREEGEPVGEEAPPEEYRSGPGDSDDEGEPIEESPEESDDYRVHEEAQKTLENMERYQPGGPSEAPLAGPELSDPEPGALESREAAAEAPEEGTGITVDDDGEDDNEDEDEESPLPQGARGDPGFFVGSRKIPRILTQEEVAEMVRISKTIPRDSILIQCMYFLGMSNAEIQNLRVEDIDFAEGMVRISQGKNRRERTLPMPKELADDLKSYIGARPEGFVIRGRDKKGKRISDRHIRRIAKAYAKEAGVRNWEEVHPHTLRHSYATHLLDQGTPIETVQSILGHERLETTSIYSHAHNTRKLQEHVRETLG